MDGYIEPEETGEPQDRVHKGRGEKQLGMVEEWQS